MKSKSKQTDTTVLDGDATPEPQDVSPEDAEVLSPEPAAEQPEMDAGAHERWQQCKLDLEAARAHLAELQREDTSAAEARISSIASGERLDPAEHAAAILRARNERQAAIEACGEIVQGLERYEVSLRQPAMDALRAEVAQAAADLNTRVASIGTEALTAWNELRRHLDELEAAMQEHIRIARDFEASHRESGLTSHPWPSDGSTQWPAFAIDSERLMDNIRGFIASNGNKPAALSMADLRKDMVKPTTPATPWRDPRQDDPNPASVVRVGDALESDAPPAEYLAHPERFQANFSASGELISLRRTSDGNTAWRRRGAA